MRRRSVRPALVAGALAATALLAFAASTRVGPVRRALGLRPLVAEPVVQQQGGGQVPAKEYIYAGGRLVATEEPTPTPTPGPVGSPPTNLVAALASVNGSAASINVSWTPPPGNVVSYIVERAAAAGQFAPVGQPTASTTITDTTAAEGSAYLYRVKAVFDSGGASDYSGTDLATAVAFSDDPLVVASTRVKAAHVTELRRAVNAVRAVSGLAAAGWTDATLPGVTVKAAHVSELRTSLDQALSGLGLTTSPYTDTSLPGVVVKKVHVEELRDRVK